MRKVTLEKLSLGKGLLFRLTVTLKLYFDSNAKSKINLVQKNTGFHIRSLITFFIAIIQTSLGRDIRL